MIKKSLISISILVLIAVGFLSWIKSMLPAEEERLALKATRASELAYLQSAPAISRGKILAVVTSTAQMGESEKTTGFELTELARAYYVFIANGFEVDIASPLGGSPPMVIDGDDMGPFDYAFLNDTSAQEKLDNSLPLDQVTSSDYRAVYFVGGKGAMFDFPGNTSIQQLTSSIYDSGGVVGAVCHGPAALLDVTLANGQSLIANKRISGFTNDEELFLIPEAREIFPFLLQDKLAAEGAIFSAGPRYLEQVSNDSRLVTGQNPWSVWLMADIMVRELGYEPRPRKITPEENSVNILSAYETRGYAEANTLMTNMLSDPEQSIDKVLIAMHGIVAIMDWQFIKLVNLLRLLLNADGVEFTVFTPYQGPRTLYRVV